MTNELKWPHNPEMEKLILGAALLNQSGDFWLEITARLDARDFALPSHRMIYKAIDALVHRGAAPEIFALRDELARTGELEKSGGLAAIGELIDGVPKLQEIETEIARVKDLSAKRDLMKLGQWITDAAAADDETAEVLFLSSEDKLTKLAANRSTLDIVDAPTAFERTMAALERAWAQPDGIVGLRTGFTDLDRMLHGLRGGKLYLLAARPGEGKTTLALNIAHNILMDSKNGPAVGLLASLEMDVEELTIRAISTMTHIDSDKLLGGKISSQERKLIDAAGRELSRMNISYIEGRGAVMVSTLRAAAMSILRKHKRIDYIMVDYVQLMDSMSKENRNLEITEIARGLKMLAMSLNIPVLALSQMSRDIERRGKNPEPQLSDLRDSGALEQDADVVMFLHDPSRNGDSSQPERKLLVKKHRGGKTGPIDLLWWKDRSEFQSAMREAA